VEVRGETKSQDLGARRGIARGRVLSPPFVWVFPLLVMFSFLLRIPSFYSSSIDWDESLYLLMARGLLKGESLYLSVWDHKPPGIYLIFAASELLFGQSVLAPRIAASLFVALSSYLLYRFGRDLLANHAVGLAAALLYAAYSVSNVGLAANTELFFTPFVILGFTLILLRGGLMDRGEIPGRGRLLAAGVCMGIALQIKYVTVFDLLGLLALVLVLARREGSGPWRARAVLACGWVVVGSALLSLLPVLYFWNTGHLSDYVYANFTANAIHSRDSSFSLAALLRLMAGQVKTNLLPWCAVLLAPFFVSVYRKSHPRCLRDLGVLAAWLAFGFVGVVFTRRINLHNFLQILPELCLIGAYVGIGSVWLETSLEKGKRRVLVLLILMMGVFRPVYDSARASLGPAWGEAGEETKDASRLVASYLAGRIEPGASLYVVDCDPILYMLTGASHPTRYVFPPFLTDDHYSRVAGVDPLAELDRIMGQSPRFVVLSAQPHASPFYLKLEDYLRSAYRKETEIERISIYSLAKRPGA
jgi:4-amino-4-deoxy-L-arabinose transferase-like glycosyltransferase